MSSIEVTLEDVSKRYTRHWVFRNVSMHIVAGERLAVKGPNGSGKSTFLRLLSGALPLSRGRIYYRLGDTPITSDTLPAHVSFAAPYAELIDEFTISELHAFHRRFKPLVAGVDDISGFLELLDYPFKPGVQIRHFSSGMKQRLKLALAICSDTEFLLLDEPGSNLDAEGKGWFQSLLRRFAGTRTIVIASNELDDYALCERSFDLRDLNMEASI